jgi:hypothetical protein
MVAFAHPVTLSSWLRPRAGRTQGVYSAAPGKVTAADLAKTFGIARQIAARHLNKSRHGKEGFGESG